ncbi:cobalamin biosynthesis protein [Winogradskya humida]|uniref:cobalamin biosynthesis protein n=1 Tax=Winogradskya humida TaxID=113566 RepID=UPI0019406C21|nr:cobalamin biosynthesis protein [Actinoplanes humidus]
MLGIGARSGVRDEELDEAAQAAVALTGAEVDAVATVERRGAAVRALATRRGWELLLFSDDELAEMDTPNVVRLTGAPSVAEAAALRGAGPGATLLLTKKAFPSVTVAIAAVVIATTVAIAATG